MKKTNRKNKTNLVVKWPTSHFTITELNKLNGDFVNITLRVRLNHAIETKEVAELGTLHIGKGRPKLVFAKAPISDKTLKSAQDGGVMFNKAYETYNTADAVSIEVEPEDAKTDAGNEKPEKVPAPKKADKLVNC